MTVDEAIAATKSLNKTGKYRDEWFYYPGYYEPENDWFVLRRLKTAQLHVAVFRNGTSGLEQL